MIDKLAVDDLAWSCPDDWLSWASSSEIESGHDHRRPGPGGRGHRVRTRHAGNRLQRLRDRAFGHRSVDHHQDVSWKTSTVIFRRRTTSVSSTTSATRKNRMRSFLEAGAGRRLRDGMDSLIEELAESLPKILNDKEFRTRMRARRRGISKPRSARWSRPSIARSARPGSPWSRSRPDPSPDRRSCRSSRTTPVASG